MAVLRDWSNLFLPPMSTENEALSTDILMPINLQSNVLPVSTTNM
jgi:hypothetical protein